jgi:hypothetical protein
MSRKINTARQVNVVIYVRTGRPGSEELSARVSRLRTVAVRQGWGEPVVITECRNSGISDQALRAIAGFDVLLIDDWPRARSAPRCTTAEICES